MIRQLGQDIRDRTLGQESQTGLGMSARRISLDRTERTRITIALQEGQDDHGRKARTGQWSRRVRTRQGQKGQTESTAWTVQSKQLDRTVWPEHDSKDLSA